MYINLRWLAYPCWLYAIYSIITGLYVLAITYDGVDIEPTIGFITMIMKTFVAIISSFLGYLIWRAFRPDKVNEDDNGL